MYRGRNLPYPRGVSHHPRANPYYPEAKQLQRGDKQREETKEFAEMKVWIAKAIVQKAISFLPFKHNINYLLQKYVTIGVFLTDALMEDKLLHCKNHLEQLAAYS